MGEEEGAAIIVQRFIFSKSLLLHNRADHFTTNQEVVTHHLHGHSASKFIASFPGAPGNKASEFTTETMVYGYHCTCIISWP